jgi:Ca2+/H+ antiporter
VVTSILLADGRSSRLKGLTLIAVYVGVAYGFYSAGDR